MKGSEMHEHHHGHKMPAPPPDGTSAAGHADLQAADAHRHEPGAHDRHAGHSVEMFRDRFSITLALTIPTLVWSDMIQEWFRFRAPTFPGSEYIPANVAFGGTDRQTLFITASTGLYGIRMRNRGADAAK